MRRTPFGLLVAASLAVSAASPSAALDSIAGVDAQRPAPELAWLDQRLALILEDRVSPERLKVLLGRFRADLEAVNAVIAPSPANAALYALILARLGEFERAAGILDDSLLRDPGNSTLRTALAQVRFDQKDYPAALAAANAVLERDPSNKEALALRHFSEGRVAMNGGTSESASSSPSPGPAPKSPSRRFHFASPDPATLPFKLPVKISPASAPPDLRIGDAPAAPGPLPWVPLAEAATLGLAAFEVSRRRAAYASSEGLDDEHPKSVGRYQRLVAGAILAGAAGAVIYTLGAAVVSAAPVALGYATSIGNHGLRLASSGVGAVNPNEFKIVNEMPITLARVIPLKDGMLISGMIGPFGQESTFVTAADDIANIPAVKLAERLGIESAPRYAIIRFPTPALNVASRITYYRNSLFVGRGLTSGGAREFQVPNVSIPQGATIEIVEVGK